MGQFIAQIDGDSVMTHTLSSVSAEVTPEGAALAMGWGDGTWKELSEEEAEILRTPPPPTLEQAVTAKLAEVMRGYNAAFAPVEAVYPAAEREGWAIQEAEARALQAAFQTGTNADPVAGQGAGTDADPDITPTSNAGADIDTASIAPVLSALVQLRARGESVADLAQAVLDNAARWRMVYAYLTGQQQRMYGEVSGLAAQDGVTAQDVAAYPVAYRMPAGVMQ